MTVDATTQKKKTHKPKTKKVSKQNIYYIIFLVLWAGLSIVASQYITMLPMVAILGAENFQKPFWVLIYYIISYAIALALVFLLAPKLFELYRAKRHSKTQQEENPLAPSVAEIGINKPPTFVDIGLAPIAYIAYAIVASVIINFFSFFSWFDANEEQNVGFGYFLSTSDRLIAMAAIVFIAPIVEELIMRGWLYGKLRSKTGVALSIFLTSIIFAVLHGQLNVGISVFVLSCTLCGLREITGTLWSSILLHILNNGIAFYIVYVAGF